MPRTCGECTACCKTHAVPSINKEPFRWCEECQIGVGCKTYSNRPQECQEFKCAWLTGVGPEDERPDKSRCVVDTVLIEGVGDVTVIHELALNAHEKSKVAQDWIGFSVAHNWPILILRERGRDKLLVPREYVVSDALRALIDDSTALHRYHVVKKGRSA